MITRYSSKTILRKTKVRAKLKRFSNRLRLSIFRSNKHLYVQIIDDKKAQTLVAATDQEIKTPKGLSKNKKAYLTGQILAKKALKKQLKKVYFDRGSYQYHGRVAQLAQGAREGGLIF